MTVAAKRGTGCLVLVGVVGLLALIGRCGSGGEAATPVAAPVSLTASASSAPPRPSPSEATPSKEILTATVPHVVGDDLEKAKRELSAAHLAVGEIRRQPSSRKEGTVLKQRVRAGSDVDLGSRVSLLIASPLPEVPSVTFSAKASAIRILRQAGFKVKWEVQTRSSGSDNVVLSQVPSEGARARPGSVVRLVVSKVMAPKPKQPPARNCTPGYSPCLPPASDYDCAGGSGNGPQYAYGPVEVSGSDPYDLDRDGDGTGCED